MAECDHSGWLEKQSGGKDGKWSLGNHFAKWERRFFTLGDDGVLRYYKTPADGSPTGKLDVNGGTVEQNGLVFTLTTEERTLMLRATDQEDIIGWVCALAAFMDGGAARGGSGGAGSGVVRSAPVDVNSQRLALGLSSARGDGGNPFASPAGAGELGSSNATDASAPPSRSYGKGAFAHSKFVAELRKDGLEDDAELKEIEQEVVQHEQQIDAATQRMVRMAQATRDQGAATLQQMEQQGQQMEAIKKDQAKVQHNLDTSDKLLKGMTSFLGWRAWGAKPAATAQYGAANTSGAMDATRPKDAATKSGRGGGRGIGGMGRGRGGGSSSGDAGGEGGEPPDAMDTLSTLMSEMHAQALSMNAELKGQSTQIDSLVDTTLNQSSQVGKATKATASVGGKAAKAKAKQGGEGSAAVAAASAAASRAVQATAQAKAPVSARMQALKAMQG